MTIKLPAQYSNLRRELAAYDFKDVKEILDKAQAMKVYAYQARDGELAEHVAEIRLEAERRLFKLKEELPETRGQFAKGKSINKKLLLNDLDIDKNLLTRINRTGRLSEEEFEQEKAEAKELARASAEGHKAVVKAARAKRHKKKKEARDKRMGELASKVAALPDKRYAVILADPEWKWEAWTEAGLDATSADNHYPTQIAKEIAKRDVPSIAAKDCVLFLWATVPLLPAALDVMGAWGFKYVSNFVWVKHKAGTGYWSRNQHEHLLIGTRGKIPAPLEGTQFKSVINAAARKHSQKPDETYEIIEKYYPDLPKIELNLRGKPRDGWDGWGNEADNGD